MRSNKISVVSCTFRPRCGRQLSPGSGKTARGTQSNRGNVPGGPRAGSEPSLPREPAHPGRTTRWAFQTSTGLPGSAARKERRPKPSRNRVDAKAGSLHQSKCTTAGGVESDDRGTRRNGGDGFIPLGPQLRVLSLNVEGLTAPKCDVLGRLGKRYRADVLLLQETHLRPESPQSSYRVDGYSIVHREDHERYGISVYARYPGRVVLKNGRTLEGGFQSITVETEGYHITNVYKPPRTSWSESVPPPAGGLPSIYMGDFNSHHHMWGYKSCDRSGLDLCDWADKNGLRLVHDPNGKRTFHHPVTLKE